MPMNCCSDRGRPVFVVRANIFLTINVSGQLCVWRCQFASFGAVWHILLHRTVFCGHVWFARPIFLDSMAWRSSSRAPRSDFRTAQRFTMCSFRRCFVIPIIFTPQALVGLERGSDCFNNPVFPDDEGLTLLPYTGDDCLTYEGEINKLAVNVAFGRCRKSAPVNLCNSVFFPSLRCLSSIIRTSCVSE